MIQIFPAARSPNTCPTGTHSQDASGGDASSKKPVNQGSEKQRNLLKRGRDSVQNDGEGIAQNGSGTPITDSNPPPHTREVPDKTPGKKSPKRRD